jgi:hypothetical protein
MKSYLVSLLIICLMSSILAAGDFLTDSMIWQWEGTGKIIVTWCEQDSLPVDIWIDENGIVTGKVGDAEITAGILRLNGVILRMLGNSRYIIDLELSGPLVEEEQITRSGGKLLLDFENDAFSGGFHSSGSKFGGKEKMVMTVVNLKLKKRIDSNQ